MWSMFMFIVSGFPTNQCQELWCIWLWNKSSVLQQQRWNQDPNVHCSQKGWESIFAFYIIILVYSRLIANHMVYIYSPNRNLHAPKFYLFIYSQSDNFFHVFLSVRRAWRRLALSLCTSMAMVGSTSVSLQHSVSVGLSSWTTSMEC